MTATASAIAMAKVAAQAAADKLAKDVLLVDVSDRLAITDIFVIVTGTNERQVAAIVDEVEEKMRLAGVKPVRREGERDGRWVLLDFLDIVVHVQHSEERVFYALDRLWKDCPTIAWVDADAPVAEQGATLAGGPAVTTDDDPSDFGDDEDDVLAVDVQGRSGRVTLSHLILMRHGETDWNAEARLQGHRDIPLNAAGLRQAVAAAPSVAALAPQFIVSSDLSRARATAEPVAALTGLTIGLDPRLRETSMGLWEGLTREDVMSGWPGEWERWRTTSAHNSPPEGESRWQVAKRASEVVAEADSGAVERALLVAHGGLIVGLTGLLLDLPDQSWGTLIGIGNCHWVVLHRFMGSWRLHSYNAGLGGVILPVDDEELAGA